MQEAAQQLQAAMAGYMHQSQQEAADILDSNLHDEPWEEHAEADDTRVQAAEHMQQDHHTPWQVGSDTFANTCSAWMALSCSRCSLP